MSIEYYAYALDSTPVPIVDLTHRCRQHGVDLRIVRGSGTWSDFRIAQDGVLESGDTVCGWDASASTAPRIAFAIDSGAAAMLAAHEDGDRLWTFEVEIWSDSTAYNADLEEWAEGYEDGYDDARARSTVRFYVRLAGGGRGPLCAEFPDFVLHRVLELRGGIIEDPQEEEFHSVARLA